MKMPKMPERRATTKQVMYIIGIVKRFNLGIKVDKLVEMSRSDARDLIDKCAKYGDLYTLGVKFDHKNLLDRYGLLSDHYRSNYIIYAGSQSEIDEELACFILADGLSEGGRIETSSHCALCNKKINYEDPLLNVSTDGWKVTILSYCSKCWKELDVIFRAEHDVEPIKEV